MDMSSSKADIAGAPVPFHTQPGGALGVVTLQHIPRATAFNRNSLLPSRMYFGFGNSDFIQSKTHCIRWVNKPGTIIWCGK